MTTNLTDRITVNPQQCGGRPCIRGMRIRVIDVLDLLAGGTSREEILSDQPALEAARLRSMVVTIGRPVLVHVPEDVGPPPDPTNPSSARAATASGSVSPRRPSPGTMRPAAVGTAKRWR